MTFEPKFSSSLIKVSLAGKLKTTASFLTIGDLNHLVDAEFRQVNDPSEDVREYILRGEGYVTELVPVLTDTLSAAVCQSFLRENSKLPISEYDYCMSKLYQFFSAAALESASNEIQADEYLQDLYTDLIKAFPPTTKPEIFYSIRWREVLQDARKNGLSGVISKLGSYPKVTEAGERFDSDCPPDLVRKDDAIAYLEVSRRYVNKLIRHGDLIDSGSGRKKFITALSLRKHKPVESASNPFPRTIKNRIENH